MVLEQHSLKHEELRKVRGRLIVEMEDQKRRLVRLEEELETSGSAVQESRGRFELVAKALEEAKAEGAQQLKHIWQS